MTGDPQILALEGWPGHQWVAQVDLEEAFRGRLFAGGSYTTILRRR